MKSALLLAVTLALNPQAVRSQVFDSHVHLREGEQSLRAYIAQAKTATSTEIRFGGMWFGGPNQALAGQPQRIRESNGAQLALAAKHPAMVPIATVHPYDGLEALAELQRVAGLGVKALKIHAHTQKFDPADARVLALVKRAGALGVVVLMDNASILPGDGEKLFNLALEAPGTRFVFAHMGGTNFRFWNILKLARTADGLFGDNVYFDISAIVTLAADSPIEDEFVWTIRNIGVEHVLLGSDFPQFTLAETLRAFDKLDLTPAEKARIRGTNARTLFEPKP